MNSFLNEYFFYFKILSLTTYEIQWLISASAKREFKAKSTPAVIGSRTLKVKS